MQQGKDKQKEETEGLKSMIKLCIFLLYISLSFMQVSSSNDARWTGFPFWGKNNNLDFFTSHHKEKSVSDESEFKHQSKKLKLPKEKLELWIR